MGIGISLRGRWTRFAAARGASRGSCRTNMAASAVCGRRSAMRTRSPPMCRDCTRWFTRNETCLLPNDHTEGRVARLDAGDEFERGGFENGDWFAPRPLDTKADAATVKAKHCETYESTA